MIKEFYKVMIVGSSGKGKSYLSRTLDPVTTAIINVEDQPLPFKEGKKFEFHTRPRTYIQVYEDLVKASKDPKIKTIFIDSFSAFSDLVLKDARTTKKGFDIWSMYNDELGKFLTLIKKIDKDIILTAHYEILNVEGSAEKRVKVKAKEWEGGIEKEFIIVLYADMIFNDEKPEYFLRTVEMGSSAKCPPGIFDTYKIPNDGKYIIDKIEEFRNAE